MSTFQEDIRSFEVIDACTLEQKMNNKEDVVAFVGRASCPFCRRFAPKLQSVANELQQHIFFVNSENSHDTCLAKVRQTHAILTVPGLLVAKNGSVKVVCDSSLSTTAIKEFILT